MILSKIVLSRELRDVKMHLELILVIEKEAILGPWDAIGCLVG